MVQAQPDRDVENINSGHVIINIISLSSTPLHLVYLKDSTFERKPSKPSAWLMPYPIVRDKLINFHAQNLLTKISFPDLSYT